MTRTPDIYAVHIELQQLLQQAPPQSWIGLMPPGPEPSLYPDKKFKGYNLPSTHGGGKSHSRTHNSVRMSNHTGGRRRVTSGGRRVIEYPHIPTDPTSFQRPSQLLGPGLSAFPEQPQAPPQFSIQNRCALSCFIGLFCSIPS